jgi:tRNA(Ile)-lysidine synthase TilS/MesJ
LGLTKNEVTEICKKNTIPFITDPTNDDTTTSLRNKLRNKVLPELYELANKKNSTTNSFIGSMKNIYEQLEQPKGKDIFLKPIDKSPHRKATFAYQRKIDSDEVTNE